MGNNQSNEIPCSNHSNKQPKEISCSSSKQFIRIWGPYKGSQQKPCFTLLSSKINTIKKQCVDEDSIKFKGIDAVGLSMRLKEKNYHFNSEQAEQTLAHCLIESGWFENLDQSNDEPTQTILKNTKMVETLCGNDFSLCVSWPCELISRIFVKSLNGETIHMLNVSFNDPIEKYATALAYYLGMHLNDIRLIFAGKLLEFDKTFSDYNLERQTTIHLVFRLKDDDQSSQPMTMNEKYFPKELKKDQIDGVKYFYLPTE